MKAFRTEAHGLESIVLCETAARAKWWTVRAARDAGYRCDFGDVTVRRAPRHDDAPVAHNRCFCEDFVDAEYARVKP